MNKTTQEYLEWLEDLPKNGRDPERVNWATLFKQAQDGDNDALNYLYETNEYIIHEAISEATQFINPDLDIQVYIDILTDVLIRGIKDFDPSHDVSFRPFIKRNMHSKLRDYSGRHTRLRRVLNTTSPISEYDTPTDEEEYPLANDVRNTAYDRASIDIYLEERPKNTAHDLWEKLKVFATEEELDLLYRAHVYGENQDTIAEAYDTTRQMISFKIVNVQKRLRKLVNTANSVYKLLNIDKLPFEEAMKIIPTKDIGKVLYYLNVFEYLYLDGALPVGYKPYGYLQYKSQKRSRKTNISQIHLIREKNKQLGE